MEVREEEARNPLEEGRRRCEGRKHEEKAREMMAERPRGVEDGKRCRMAGVASETPTQDRRASAEARNRREDERRWRQR